MSKHHVDIFWQRAKSEIFTDKQYSRAHTWSFDGGARIDASSSPSVVPLPHSVAENVDPEEAFVAAVSSCHMLWFLGIAAEHGLVVDTYRDQATGVLRRDAEGRLAITDITLRPDVVFSGPGTPDAAKLRELHDSAHHQCFIANSIKTRIHLEVNPDERK